MTAWRPNFERSVCDWGNQWDELATVEEDEMEMEGLSCEARWWLATAKR